MGQHIKNRGWLVAAGLVNKHYFNVFASKPHINRRLPGFCFCHCFQNTRQLLRNKEISSPSILYNFTQVYLSLEKENRPDNFLKFHTLFFETYKQVRKLNKAFGLTCTE